MIGGPEHLKKIYGNVIQLERKCLDWQWPVDEDTALVCLIVGVEMLRSRGYSQDDAQKCVEALIACLSAPESS